MQDPYTVLGINEEVTDEEVQAAYHRNLRQYPPEEHPEKFASISEAYECIRTEHDRISLYLLGKIPALDELGLLAGQLEHQRPGSAREPWLRNAQRLWLTRDLS